MAYFMYMKAKLQKDSSVSQIMHLRPGQVYKFKRQDNVHLRITFSATSCHVISVKFLIHAFM